jgi:hypothetical protein
VARKLLLMDNWRLIKGNSLWRLRAFLLSI